MVTCQICGKQMNWIQNTHLNRHNMTLNEYRRKFPDVPTKTEEMHNEIVRTRYRAHRTPIKLCARPDCSNPVKKWKHNKYCSSRCNALDNPLVGLHHKGYSKELNPGYIDGDYMQCKSQKHKAYERDNGCCIKCGAHVGGKDQKYGVHHLVPRRLFVEDKELADSLENLVTLCSKHHKEVESMFADLIFKLYTGQDYKSLDDLMLYLRQNV